MKKILAIAPLLFTLAAKAQTKEGKVIYERTMQMSNMRFGGNLPPEVQAQMAKPRTDQHELLFTSQHSLYQFLPNAADEGSGTFSGGGVTIQMRGGTNDISYVDFATGTRIDQREVMEKSFIVSDTITKLKWKLSEETKTILNFTARKASSTTVNTRPRMTMENGEMKREVISDTVNVIAWYTTDVPVPAGPAYTGQLPGLILELDVNNGQSITRAIEFSPKVAANKIKEPKDGKKLTAAEFTKEREKLLEEMRKNMPAGNVIRMN
ncbi:MAG TPA: GLPGLI family protein [Flavisolibacter sp.]|jgi:GLPGLI family protein|nr:GLPGLI family protein [Flavisolibacter sp.]